ncbi:MAG: hypothetical protein K0Q79_190 [Flavipsychrobacter sp.]|jgi:hypothetical protein|nr:hypothetical protein [Flavipsychrobacter sp.]
MKKLIFFIAIFIGCYGYSSNAQVSFQLNIGSQPLWGPAGYDYARYYYIPAIDAYYDISAQQYVYYNNGGWGRYSYLPPRYRNFDLYGAYKVVINNPNPWTNHNSYRNRYSRYGNRGGQVVIRDSRDNRYWANPRHPKHGEWRGTQRSRDWGGYRDRRNDNRNNWNDNRGRGRDRDDNRGRGRDWDKK